MLFGPLRLLDYQVSTAYLLSKKFVKLFQK